MSVFSITGGKIYALSDVTGLRAWVDYIPVAAGGAGRANSFDDEGYMTPAETLTSVTGLTAWVDYIPVYVTTGVSKWRFNDDGYIAVDPAYLSSPFSPASLFASGEQGAWYDPSDFSTMYQDSAGTIPVTAVEQTVGYILDKSGRSNHATASADASRPVLRARHNLLTYSEQFDNVAWGKTNVQAFGSGSVANATTAPDGTTTADKIVETATTAAHYVSVTTAQTGNHTASVYAKAAERQGVYLQITLSTGGANAFFNLSSGVVTLAQGYGGASTPTAAIQSVGDGWYRCSITTASGNVTAVRINLLDAADATTGSYAGDGTSGLFLWGADLRSGTSIGTYQRIAASTDYALTSTMGGTAFPLYLDFDGVDDSFSTSAIDFSASDKMSIFVGVTKDSDSATAMLAEISASATANNGAWYLTAPESGATYGVRTRGTTAATGYNHATFTAPLTNVIAISLNNGGASGTAANCVSSRFNGVANTTGAIGGTTSAGNFGNHALYIGRRAAATLPFNGRIYSFVVRGATSSADEIAAAETYVAGKTGVTLP